MGGWMLRGGGGWGKREMISVLDANCDVCVCEEERVRKQTKRCSIAPGLA